MENHGSRACSPTPAYRVSERLARREPVGPRQHLGCPFVDQAVKRPGKELVRRPDGCGPCGGGTPEWRGRRGCASAGGNRAPCAGDGCSAGTYACSRDALRCRVLSSLFTDRVRRQCLCLFGWHRPPAAIHHCHSMSGLRRFSVDMRHRSTPVRPHNGTRCWSKGSNSARFSASDHTEDGKTSQPVMRRGRYQADTPADLRKHTPSTLGIPYHRLWTTA